MNGIDLVVAGHRRRRRTGGRGMRPSESGGAALGRRRRGSVDAERRASSPAVRAWARTSAAVRRPPAPVAAMSAGSSWCSSSSRRTTGERKAADPVVVPVGWRAAASGGRRRFGALRVGTGSRPVPELGRHRRRGRRCDGGLVGPGRADGVTGTVTDSGQRGSDRHGVALGDQDLVQHARRRGRDLGVDLVGRDLQQRLVDLDVVADRLQPTRHGALGDGFAQLRHADRRDRAFPL